jgi:hypothetical protein
LFHSYSCQHIAEGEHIVEGWTLEKYFDIMKSIGVVTSIQRPEEPWGDFLSNVHASTVSCILAEVGI